MARSKDIKILSTPDFVLNKSKSHDYDYCLYRMVIELKMDRPVDNGYYISPGGFIITCKNLDGMQIFDFLDVYGTIDKVDPTYVTFVLKEFDYEFSSPSLMFDLRYLNSWDFKDFFINTGELYDAEIHPVSIEKLVFIDKKDRSYNTPESVLASANRTLHD